MVQFNKEKTTVNIEMKYCDQDSHIRTIQSLLYFLSHCNTEFIDAPNEIYYVCRLIEDMLPAHNQILDTDEVELFEQFKKQQR